MKHKSLRSLNILKKRKDLKVILGSFGVLNWDVMGMQQLKMSNNWKYNVANVKLKYVLNVNLSIMANHLVKFFRISNFNNGSNNKRTFLIVQNVILWLKRLKDVIIWHVIFVHMNGVGSVVMLFILDIIINLMLLAVQVYSFQNLQR
jgi:hypothetical protein